MTFNASDMVFPELPAGLYWQVTSERDRLQVSVEEEIKNPYVPNWFMRYVVGDSDGPSWRVIASDTLRGSDITVENVDTTVERLYLQATLTTATTKETK